MSDKVVVGAKLKDKIRREFTKPHKSGNGLDILKLEMNEDYKDTKNLVQKLSLGNWSDQPEKVILLMGATGSGKTTLINAMVNYIYGIDFEDSFRFSVIDKETPERSQEQSQTDYITAYFFGYQPGMPKQRNYVIIDTPGTGDTRGITQDEKMMGQLKTFLKGECGVDKVDFIGNVVSASTTKLTPTQQYLFDSMASMFGKDTEEYMFIMTTFADGSTPPIIDTLKKAKVVYQDMFMFNNCALFPSSNKATKSMKNMWDMSTESMDKLFQDLGSVSPVSMQLTRDVLGKRIELKESISTIHNVVHLGLEKLSHLEKKKELLTNKNKNCSVEMNEIVLKDDCKEIKRHENVFVFIYKKFLSFLTKSLEYIAKLFNKKLVPFDEKVEECIPFVYEKGRQTVREVLDHYKMSKDKTICLLKEEIKILEGHLLILIEGALLLVQELNEIALKPIYSTKDYLDVLIKSEETHMKFGWQDRVKGLMNLQKEDNILQAVSSGNGKSSNPEGILKFLWGIIKE
ncbi:uncharacterized protein LOC143037518 isoform X2 [Oratosquilla oratoria]|uniref:uncharacterized protein LOC143037518 isoform X2 n=1 Tax=Oratosquilla oratoria TaxID=337810 RepID=UPI003F77037D